MLESFEKKPVVWWRYIDDIFFIWEYGEESLKIFMEQVKIFHSTIKFTAEYSNKEVNFLDVNIKLIDGELKKIWLLDIRTLVRGFRRLCYTHYFG